jgi:hypothetical protein
MTAGTTSTPARVEAPSKPRRDRTHWPGALVVTAATAVLALASGVTGLVFDLWPSLRPDPRTQLGSEAAVVAIDRYVTRDEYLRRRFPGAAAYRRARRREVERAQGQVGGMGIAGELAYVSVTVHGFKGRRVNVSYSIYDARRQVRRTPAHTEARWTGDAPNDQFMDEIWLEPVFGGRERYFVRVEVRGPNGVLLTLADSRPFAGLRLG